MDFAADQYQHDLVRIKDNIKESYEYFEDNYRRFNEFRKFVFESSLTQKDRDLLQALQRPVLEFNVLEAYVSRILGELYQQKPGVQVTSNNPENINPQVIKFLEVHLRSVFEDRNNRHKVYEFGKDILSGGFSAAKVFTDYTSEMSMRQMIDFNRAFDPTLCGWDPAARLSHKGDGNYCFEIIPKTKEELKSIFPKLDVKRFSYSKAFEGFKWSYKSNKKDYVLVVDYYEKKKKSKKIVELSDGRIIFDKDWKKELEAYENPLESLIMQISSMTAPYVVKDRYTTIETICRYRLCENKVLEYTETDYNHLPIIFLDGNSILLRNNEGSDIRQITRPFVYHAKGAQQLKNASGIALANEIENSVQHKFMIKQEALPENPDYLDAWTQYQKPSLMVYQGYLDNNPDQPIDNPVSPVPRVGAPAEIVQAFTGADSLVQTILGSYDASLGINNNQLSGRAIQEGAKQSNTAVMPYITGLMDGLQRIAQIYVSLVPKYYKTPVTLPYVDTKGNRKYVKLGKDDDILNYDDNVLNVVVEAGPSFRVQKEHTLTMVKELMGVSEQFAAFVNAKGLDFILDNMEGHGIDRLKQMVDEWTKQQEQIQQQKSQQPNPEMLKQQNEQQKLLLENKRIEINNQISQLKLQQDKQQEQMKMFMAEHRNQTELMRQEEKQELEEMRIQLEHIRELMALKLEELKFVDQKKGEHTNEQD